MPGTGTYEWQGFRKDLPRELNPARGFIATANHNIKPEGYSPPLMFKTADTRFERITRLRQMFEPGRKYSIDDHQRMQHDALSLRALADVPRFNGWTASDPDVERRARCSQRGTACYASATARPRRSIETWREGPGNGSAGRGAAAGGDAPETTARPAEASLKAAIARLTASQGADWKTVALGPHARARLPAPVRERVRPADGRTRRAAPAPSPPTAPATARSSTSSNWDRSLVTNTPGQSGQPGSPFYGNLLPLWADDVYFPLAFSSGAVEANAAHRLTLNPAK